MTLCKQAQNIFDSFCEIQVVPISQLFGGKIVEKNFLKVPAILRRFINQKIVLESQFSGMTNDVFSYEMFEATRKLLVEVINSHLSMEDKALLMSFAEGIPLWPDKDYSIYPGVRWKLLNIK